jgi:hypothetical protein
VTSEEIAAELRELISLAGYYGCEYCLHDEDNELADRLSALEHSIALDSLASASR